MQNPWTQLSLLFTLNRMVIICYYVKLFAVVIVKNPLLIKNSYTSGFSKWKFVPYDGLFEWCQIQLSAVIILSLETKETTFSNILLILGAVLHLTHFGVFVYFFCEYRIEYVRLPLNLLFWKQLKKKVKLTLKTEYHLELMIRTKNYCCERRWSKFW